MFLFNTKTKTRPVAIHAPGFTETKWIPSTVSTESRVNTELNPLWKPICEAWRQLEISDFTRDPSGPRGTYSVLTFNNLPGVKGILQESLERLSIPYVVLGQEIREWRNLLKLQLLNEHVRNLATDYVFVFDCFDVLILRDLSFALDYFTKMNCKMLLNGEPTFWPDFGPQFITSHLKHWQSTISNSAIRFLNSGMILAETKFFAHLLAEMNSPTLFESYDARLFPTKEARFGKRRALDSDQFIYHFMYAKYHPDIKIDHDMGVFVNIVGQRRLPHHILWVTPGTSSFGLWAIRASAMGHVVAHHLRGSTSSVRLKVRQLRHLLRFELSDFKQTLRTFCFTPRCFLRALWHKITHRNSQWSLCQIAHVLNAIKTREKCRLLVFGTGDDSPLWHRINHEGETVFLEDQIDRIVTMKSRAPYLKIEPIAYRTSILDYKTESSPDALKGKLDVPEHILRGSWDVVLVDGPLSQLEEGVRRSGTIPPGRCGSIYLASQLTVKEGVIFLDDCQNELERHAMSGLLKNWRVVNELRGRSLMYALQRFRDPFEASPI